MHTKKLELPSQEYLKECFHYDLLTGDLVWKTRPAHHFSRASVCNRWNAKYANKLAGSKHSKGYRQISLRGGNWFAHRIIWKLMLSIDLGDCIDHINHNRIDNGWINLRSVSCAENNKNVSMSSNNISGVTGVSWCRKNRNWQTHVGHESQGYYSSLQSAEMAVIAARARKGYHENHGK